MDSMPVISLIKDGGVGEQVFSFDVCNLPETTKMELVKLDNVLAVECPLSRIHSHTHYYTAVLLEQ